MKEDCEEVEITGGKEEMEARGGGERGGSGMGLRLGEKGDGNGRKMPQLAEFIQSSEANFGTQVPCSADICPPSAKLKQERDDASFEFQAKSCKLGETV
ncbi:hypothetical protein Ancab_017701 [Ancistrocladus abbreviatus]